MRVLYVVNALGVGGAQRSLAEMLPGLAAGGTVPAAAAIISGIEDALSEYDLRIDETPISPARLFELIQA